MEISDDLLCLYSAQVTERDDSYTVDVPVSEVALGSVRTNTSYRVALIPVPETGHLEQPGGGEQPGQPPVDEGEIREVKIEDVGSQGDGIARVNRGYVVFVSETMPGDRVTIRITETRENVAFAEVVQRLD